MNLDYKIIYSNKRKTLSLCVERDKTIVVRAPSGVSEEKIHQMVESKKLWLYEKLNYTPKYPDKITHKEFVSGETILYLGRNYPLEITDDQIPDV